MTMWMMLDVIQDSELLRSIREEVSTAHITNSKTGSQALSLDKITDHPLLQYVFAESLRIRINFSLMRSAKEAVTLDSFTPPKAS